MQKNHRALSTFGLKFAIFCSVLARVLVFARFFFPEGNSKTRIINEPTKGKLSRRIGNRTVACCCCCGVGGGVERFAAEYVAASSTLVRYG